MEQQKLKGKNPYADESIQSILIALSYRDQYPEEYELAFLALHGRYMKIIYAACSQACKYFSNSSELAQEIAGNVFLIACEKAVEFEPRDGPDEEAEFKRWLVELVKGQVKLFTAHNPERKSFSSVDELPTEPESLRDELDDRDNLQETDYPISKESVREVLESLKPRDRDIVMAYLTHVHRKNAHLPDDVMQNLCLKYGTTSMNVRKIKQRVFTRIREINGE
jgi:DNA-directed RNA polymerase specialized sigma24 family protein